MAGRVEGLECGQNHWTQCEQWHPRCCWNCCRGLANDKHMNWKEGLSLQLGFHSIETTSSGLSGHCPQHMRLCYSTFRHHDHHHHPPPPPPPHHHHHHHHPDHLTVAITIITFITFISIATHRSLPPVVRACNRPFGLRVFLLKIVAAPKQLCGYYIQDYIMCIFKYTHYYILFTPINYLAYSCLSKLPRNHGRHDF